MNLKKLLFCLLFILSGSMMAQEQAPQSQKTSTTVVSKFAFSTGNLEELKNIDYDVLRAAFEGNAADARISVKISFEGEVPEVADGQLTQFVIEMKGRSGNLEKIIQKLDTRLKKLVAEME